MSHFRTPSEGSAVGLTSQPYVSYMLTKAEQRKHIRRSGDREREKKGRGRGREGERGRRGGEEEEKRRREQREGGRPEKAPAAWDACLFLMTWRVDLASEACS